MLLRHLMPICNAACLPHNNNKYCNNNKQQHLSSNCSRSLQSISLISYAKCISAWHIWIGSGLLQHNMILSIKEVAKVFQASFIAQLEAHRLLSNYVYTVYRFDYWPTLSIVCCPPDDNNDGAHKSITINCDNCLQLPFNRQTERENFVQVLCLKEMIGPL